MLPCPAGVCLPAKNRGIIVWPNRATVLRHRAPSCAFWQLSESELGSEIGELLQQQAAQQWDKPEDVKEESLLKRGTSKTATRSAPRHANRTLAAPTPTRHTPHATLGHVDPSRGVSAGAFCTSWATSAASKFNVSANCLTTSSFA